TGDPRTTSGSKAPRLFGRGESGGAQRRGFGKPPGGAGGAGGRVPITRRHRGYHRPGRGRLLRGPHAARPRPHESPARGRDRDRRDSAGGRLRDGPTVSDARRSGGRTRSGGGPHVLGPKNQRKIRNKVSR